MERQPPAPLGCPRSLSLIGLSVVLLALTLLAEKSFAREDEETGPGSVLSAEQWREVDRSVERALAWIAKNQDRDGSFQSIPMGQPGVTSLCVLAFLANGRLPGEGPYGQSLEDAVKFVLSCQQPDGLFSFLVPEPIYRPYQASHTAVYNNAVAGLMLSELYGMTSSRSSDGIREGIVNAVKSCLANHRSQAPNPADRGGWRYLHLARTSYSDLSSTSWQLMFLRSAKNAGFIVPTEIIDQATEYVKRCFDAPRRTFCYGSIHPNRRIKRAMGGAGILSLSLAGLHNSEMAQTAGSWLLEHPFDRYNVPAVSDTDRFHYACFYCSQAMYQLGGRYWEGFFPTFARTLLDSQSTEGSWRPERNKEAMFGNVYTTAMVVLGLSASNQLLPIFQR